MKYFLSALSGLGVDYKKLILLSPCEDAAPEKHIAEWRARPKQEALRIHFDLTTDLKVFWTTETGWTTYLATTPSDHT